MDIGPTPVFERLSQYRLYAVALRWLMLAVGLLILALHLQELPSTVDLLAWRSAQWWRFWGEALLLLAIIALILLSLAADRKRFALERELDRRGARLHELAEHIGDVFWLVDVDTHRMLYVSPAYEALWGRPAEDLLEEPDQWLASIVPEDRERVARARPHQREAGYDVEYRVERPDGTRRWVRDRSFPIADEQGRVRRLAGIATDVTERRAMAEQLQQRDRLLNLATRMARLGGWTIALERDIVTLNDEACKILELAPGSRMNLEQVFSFFPPNARRQVTEALDDSITRQRPRELEVQAVTALGSYIWVRLQGHPVLDSDGRVVRVEGAMQDITERKHTSNLLAQSHQRFREFADAMPHLIWAADPSGRIDYGNVALERCLGCDQTQALLDENWHRAMHSEDRHRYRQAWESALETGRQLHIEIRLHHSESGWRWHTVQARPVRDDRGAVVKWYGCALDVHERRESEERLITTLESITDAFFTLDHQWRFVYVNREAERLLRMPREQMRGRSIWDLFPGAVGSAFETHYRRAAQTERKQSFEAFYEPLGLWVAANVYPSPEGLSVYFQDVTERRRIAAEREHMRELENERELADRANRTKSQFLASMSHEIRTPINGIVGMVDVLHQTSLRGPQVEMIDIIRESAQSLLGIVDDILDFSKIEAGRLELSIAPFSPAAVVRSVCLLLDRMALNQEVELTLFTDPDLPAQLEGDELRVRQVLLNLVSNAIKFSSRLDRPGRVRVRLYAHRRDARSVTLHCHVLDNGIGMSPETLSRLFSPFSQADVSTTRQYGGTGLGLSISHRLVTMMGGDIKVSSEPHVGSEFRVSLPLAVVADRQDSPLGRLPRLDGSAAVVWPDGLGEDLARYLAAAGARVGSPGSLPEAPAVADEPWLLVRDLGASEPQVEPSVPAPLEAAEVRWLLIGRGHRRRARRSGRQTYCIDGNSLSQLAFLHAAAAALGREAVDPLQSGPGQGGARKQLLDREQALARGRLVLIVEDNETNQQVIRHQLEQLGYAADVCGNGQDALERWRQVGSGYALILSDLHMPAMDGYELIARLRDEEAARRVDRPVPFVALTANALAGEADRCRALGMDDYLVKPIALSALDKALEAILNKDGGAPGGAESEQEPLDPPGEVLDLSVLRDLIGGDETLVDEFVDSFLNSSTKLVEQLRHAAAVEEWDRVAEAAHSIKSSARSLGARGLADQALALERWGRQARPDVALARELLEAFESEWRGVRQALDRRNNSGHTGV